MPRNKILAETGKRPEDLTREEREAYIMATPQFQRHIKALELEKDDNPSSAYKSKRRLSRSAAEFINECLNRDVLFKGEDKVYSSIEDLTTACTDFVAFCLEHEYTMTMTSLSLWLGVSDDTIRLAVSHPELNERFGVLRNVRQIMESLLEHELMNNEGNPSGKIFMAKCKFDWQEQPQQINLNIGTQQAISPGDLLLLAQNTPIEVDYQEMDD